MPRRRLSAPALSEASSKASGEKVGGDAIEAYLRNACTVQLGSLKSAVVIFRMKNGMAKKTAGDDADMTIDDYVATSVDKYQFMADMNEPQTRGRDSAPQHRRRSQLAAAKIGGGDLAED